MKKIILMCLLVLSLQVVLFANQNKIIRPGIYPIGYCLPDPNPEVGPEIYWLVIAHEGGDSIVECYACPPGCIFDFEKQQVVRIEG